MGLRYRKQIKLFSGVKLNISKTGISTSIGKPGNTLNVSSRGVKSTVGLPGTGLSYSQMLSKGRRRSRTRSRGSTRQNKRALREEFKAKYGLKDSEVDHLIKLYRKHPRRFLRMSEPEMMAYATRRRLFSGRPLGNTSEESSTKSTIGSRFTKFILWVILIILIIAFLASFSRK